MIKLVSCSVILSLIVTAVQAEYSVNDLRGECKLLVNEEQLMNEALDVYRDTGSFTRFIENNYSFGFCNAAIAAYVDIGIASCNTARLFNKFNGQPFAGEMGEVSMRIYFPHAIALEDEWLYRDLAEIFTLWAERNAKYWSEPMVNGLQLAFVDQFKCSME